MSKISFHLDFNMIKGLNFEKLQEYFDSIHDKNDFCQQLIKLTLAEPSISLLKIMSSLFQFPTNFQLREEIVSYFGLPAFVKLSETKLKYEVELCQDPRLLEAVENISNNLSDSPLKLQTEFPLKFALAILNSSDLEFIEEAVKFVTLLLSQPSCRRFLKPLLEDILFGSIMKFKGVNQEVFQDFENVFYFPIDEVSGVYYESYEEYVALHFSKVRTLQEKLLNIPELGAFAKSSQSSFISYGNIAQAIGNLNVELIQQILLQIGIDGYSRDLPKNVLIDAIASQLVLRPNTQSNVFSIFPTEVNLQLFEYFIIYFYLFFHS